MKPRDIFIKACNEIAIPFIAMGFKPSKNGQCLKKISKDKNLTFEIWFRSSVYNSSCSVAIYPLITITCKNLKKWVQEENLNVNDDGLVYHNHIGYLSPINQYQSWDLAGLSYAPSIKTIIDLFEERKKKVVLTAPTGRAAKKMTEATGKEASTLHRLLGIGRLSPCPAIYVEIW